MKKLGAIICVVLLAGCYNDKADKLYPAPTTATPCDTSNVTYSNDVKPILLSSCAKSACHDAATPSNGYDFSGYTGAMAAALNGRLLGTVKQASGETNPMPKGLPKLDSCSINKITRWVNQGAPNN